MVDERVSAVIIKRDIFNWIIAKRRKTEEKKMVRSCTLVNKRTIHILTFDRGVINSDFCQCQQDYCQQ